MAPTSPVIFTTVGSLSIPHGLSFHPFLFSVLFHLYTGISNFTYHAANSFRFLEYRLPISRYEHKKEKDILTPPCPQHRSTLLSPLPSLFLPAAAIKASQHSCNLHTRIDCLILQAMRRRLDSAVLHHLRLLGGFWRRFGGPLLFGGKGAASCLA